MLSKGTYWIGDLCYILNKANGFVWDFVLQETGFLGLYEEGTLENMNPDNATGYFKFLGVEFFSSGTANGDGLFYDQSGNPYPVDAGVIGCFPTASLTFNVPFVMRMGTLVSVTFGLRREVHDDYNIRSGICSDN